jgi:nucleoside-diphosphate-sugar epimerase
MSELHVILGAGPLGLAVMRELRARGRRLRLVSRTGKADAPARVEIAPGDVTDPHTAHEVCRGASVVYNCLNAPYTHWPELFPKLMAGAIEGAASAGAKLICADNLYMYGPVSGPLTEDLPNAAAGRKGRVRAQIAETLMGAHAAGKLRAAIGRASDFYGPGVLDSAVGERVFAHALQGKPADVMGNPDLPHTYTFIGDFARGLVTLGERDEALGRIWHVPSAPTLTTRQFVQLVYKGSGTAPKLRAAPRPLVTVMGWFVPIIRELEEMLYEFEKPFVVDHSRFAQAFGAQTTPHEVAIRQTLEWYRVSSAGLDQNIPRHLRAQH